MKQYLNKDLYLLQKLTSVLLSVKTDEQKITATKYCNLFNKSFPHLKIYSLEIQIAFVKKYKNLSWQ